MTVLLGPGSSDTGGACSKPPTSLFAVLLKSGPRWPEIAGFVLFCFVLFSKEAGNPGLHVVSPNFLKLTIF